MHLFIKDVNTDTHTHCIGYILEMQTEELPAVLMLFLQLTFNLFPCDACMSIPVCHISCTCGKYAQHTGADRM